MELNRVIVIAEHIGTDPKNVVLAAKKANNDRKKLVESDEEDEFDEVWVVFDTEGPQHSRGEAVRNAIEQAKNLKFHTAVSNPCFEFWLLLHFERYVKTIADGKACFKLLKRHLPKYTKGTDAYASTREHVQKAITNAKQIFRERGDQKEATHPCDLHPCTEVYRLIQSLLGQQ